MRERAKVVEHRITSHFFPAGKHYVVRYWIESDPEHGGIDLATADMASADAENEAYKSAMLVTISQDVLANHLLESIPSANSVEVCDEQGNGVTIHRDWP